MGGSGMKLPHQPLITEEVLQAELQDLEVEAMGWLALHTPGQAGAYLHLGNPLALCGQLNADQELVIEVVGQPNATMAGMNVLWVG
jgi:hypothetical protein